MAKKDTEKKDAERKYMTERVVDELGRMVLPIDQRQALGIGIKTKCTVEVTEDGKGILIRRLNSACSLCHREHEELAAIADGFICPNCVALLHES